MMSRNRWSSAALAALLVFAFAALTGCGRPSTERPGGKALIQNKGSDSMVIVALVWAERYSEVQDRVGVAVTGGGSGVGISGLLNGTADLANATRKMKPGEVERARAGGHEPVATVVGYDAPAFIVHENNPVQALTFDQLAGIYGEGGSIESWSQLGVNVPGCSSDEIVRVSRQSSSGTNEYLRQVLLGSEGEYKLNTRDMQGSKDVVELVAATPCAIGYTGMAYAPLSRVKLPCIARDSESPCATPSMQSAVDGSYPIARPLMTYTLGQPEGAVADYLDWIRSDEGQCIVREVGYAPMRPVHCPDSAR
jgi:phosphate transport system substrate-binding protein